MRAGMTMLCQVHDLGLMEYEQAWQIQQRFGAEIAEQVRPATLLLLEHPHVFTFGRDSQAAHLLWDAEALEKRGVTVYWVDRSGAACYHGPGQLVGYPLLPLGSSQLQPTPDDYVATIEQVLIAALMSLGLTAGRLSGKPGVWVPPEVARRYPKCPPESRKRASRIATVGVKVGARGVSYHGFGLNVNPDMSYWQGISGGEQAETNLCLADLFDPAADISQVKEAVMVAFGEVFGYEMQK